MYGWILAWALLGAAPAPGQESPAVLFVEQGRALREGQGQGLSPRVSALLERERLSLMVRTELAAACRGERTCLARLGHSQGAAFVVRLEAEALADTLGVHLEALSSASGEAVLETAFVAGPVGSEVLEAEVRRFAGRLRALLEPPAPDEPALDAPLALPLPTPAERLPLPVRALPVSGTPRPSRTLAYATGSGALVTAGAALTLGLVGWSAKSRLEDSAAMPRSQAEGLVRRANLSFSLALSSAVLSAGLGTVCALLWNHSPATRTLTNSSARSTTR